MSYLIFVQLGELKAQNYVYVNVRLFKETIMYTISREMENVGV